LALSRSSYRGKIVLMNARQQGISSRIHYVHQTRLISEHPVFVSREIFHSTARLLVRSLIPDVYLWPMYVGLSRTLPVEPSWALYLHIGTVSRSGESRKRSFIGPPAEERRDTWTWTWNGVGWVVYEDRHDTYSHGDLSFLLLLFLLPTFPPSLSRLYPCTSKTRDIYTAMIARRGMQILIIFILWN